MPQPLSRAMPNADVVLGIAGDRPLLRHPQLAALAIEAIASWSNVEDFMLNMFVELLGGNESLATNIFLSLENQSAKNAAIYAAVNTVLKEKQDALEVFKAIMAISKTNEKSRNKLVHWTWGDSPNIPDGLLLIDPKASISNFDKSEIYVYKESDFTSIIESNDELCRYLLRFGVVLRSLGGNSTVLNELKEEPEIQERLQ